MRYTSSSIDRVREADIVKTIGEFIELKKEGSVYKCRSPFSEEKTPSFVVSPIKQIFKCFSSGLGGDGIKFVMQHKAVDFIEAIEIIAKIQNIYLEKEEVTPELQRKLDQKAEMYTLVDRASLSFVNAYQKLDNKHWAKQLISERQFNEKSIIDFQIGYSSNENKLTKWTIENGTLGVSKELGLSKTKNTINYDVFRERIMFPIHNEKGTIVGFGGRQSNDLALNKSYKYINSKESLIYDKSIVLYGLFQAKHIINKTGSAILTEGYTDVISMHQNGCENTVASSGTALTNKHALKIKKYASEIILLRDGDAAGIKATIRDIDVCLENGLHVSLCMLPDGEDPDTFARQQQGNMQLWINDNKHDALLWKVRQYDFKRDRYDLDVEDIKRTTKLQIKALQNTIKPLEDLEGEELKEAKSFNKSVSDEISEIKKQSIKEIKDVPLVDPTKKTNAVSEVAETLFKIKHEVKRNEYIKQISKTLKVTSNVLKNEIGNLEIKATDEAKRKKETTGELYSSKNIKLPKGGDLEEYLCHGFITIGNQFYFRVDGQFIEGTDFKFVPLFQIMGEKENKRLAEITNTANQKKIIEFESEMLASFDAFRKFLFRQNGFLFYVDNKIRPEHFARFVRRFNRDFEPAHELLAMGWNSKGFYAFANGVEWNGKFRSVNKYGIMCLEGINEVDNEYNLKTEKYYSPAFSVMHKDNQEGDDPYENDRYFVYKKSPITLEDWMLKMVAVFEEKGIIGILFNFGTLFRDLFITHYSSFPLLGGFGETGSGKSAFGLILQRFFYYRMDGIDLTQASASGLAKTLTRTANTVVFCDEFKDKKIKEGIGNLVMGGWNGTGRIKSKDVGSTKTTVEKILSSIYYCGQFLPTFQDGALSNRTIGLYFKKIENRPSKEKEKFTDLLNCCNQGLNSLITDVIKHRHYFEKKLPNTYFETERDLKSKVGKEQYDERVFKNTLMLLTTYYILKDRIIFPFKEETLLSLCVNLIIENSEQISESSGLTEFWSIITFLFESGYIKNGQDFVIEKSITVNCIGEKRKPFSYENQERKQILYLRLKSVYQFYNKEVTKREGVDVIGQSTIRNYFKSRPYFIGLVKGKRFGKSGSQSCYAFDYSKMVEKGLVTLKEDLTLDNDKNNKTKNTDGEDDLPF